MQSSESQLASRLRPKGLIAGVLAVLLSFMVLTTPSSASTSVSYDFNTANQLTSQFNSYVQSGTISQSNNGGISDSGAINAPGSANAVFASKDTYSLGPEGSNYTFKAFLKSVGNSGYSGMGFTSLTPSAANAGTVGFVFRPNDALGVSVHGGGYVFHWGSCTYSGSWNSNSDMNVNSGACGATLNTVTPSTSSDLLNSGSTDQWYQVVLMIERTAGNRFKMRVEVDPSTSAGVLTNTQFRAVIELTGIQNSTIISAPSISSYINFSGDRVRYFDNYQVDLVGSTVIQAGTPVVLTTSRTESNGVVTMNGNVTSDGGATISERGFVLSTNQNPTTSDTKVVVSGTTGTYSGSSGSLASGTYYIRAFATNATGTSYGEQLSITVTATSYAITYDANGATSGSAPASQSKSPGVNITLRSNSGSLVRTNFLFDGWNTAANGTGTSYAEGATYSTDAGLTLYAKWLPTFTITYDGNGHTGGSVPNPQTGRGSVSIASNPGELTRPGFIFAGWGAAADAATAVSSPLNLTSNTTLFAVWTVAPIPVYSGPFITEFSKRTLNEGEASQVVLGGERLNQITGISIDGKRVEFSLGSDGKLLLSLPALTVGKYDLRLTYGTGAVLTHLLAFEVIAKPVAAPVIAERSYRVFFAGNSAALSAQSQRAIRLAVAENSSAKSVVCNGTTSSRRATANDRRLAVRRAQNVCSAVAALIPGIQTVITSSPANGVGGNFRSAELLFSSEKSTN